MDRKEEKWLAVPTWEGLYEVSNHGQVRSLDKWVNNNSGGLSLKKGKIRVLYRTTQGYLKITLKDKGNHRQKTYSVHRLVAEAFIPNPDNLPEVNHKNEIKDFNHVDNLEWCTSQYNMTYNDLHIRNTNQLKKEVYQYDKELTLIKKWESAPDAAREGDFTQQGIQAVCNGYKQKSHKGFIWSYTELKKPLS